MIPDSVLGAKLDRETAGVASGVGGSALTSDGRETGSRFDLGTNLGEKLRASEVRDVVSDFENTVGSSSLGVNDTLGNTFTIKVGETEKRKRCGSATLSAVRDGGVKMQPRTHRSS